MNHDTRKTLRRLGKTMQRLGKTTEALKPFIETMKPMEATMARLREVGAALPGAALPEWMRYDADDDADDDVAPVPAPARRVETTAGAETRCRRWLAELMETERPSKAKAEYAEDAKREFGIGRRSFDRAWSAAISDTGCETWGKPGRRKSSRK